MADMKGLEPSLTFVVGYAARREHACMDTTRRTQNAHLAAHRRADVMSFAVP